MTAATSRTWRATHVYCHSGKAATDALLLEVVGPFVRTLQQRGLVDGWFFIRYWEGGPHLRIRLAGSDVAALDEACAGLRHALRSALAAAGADPELDPATFYAPFGLDASRIAELGWTAHGTVREEPYEPEVERYGGTPAAMAVAEELFQVSSDIALAAIAGSSTDEARTGMALELLLSFCPSIFDRPADSVRWLREYAVMWRYLDAAVAAGSAQMRAAAESTFVTSRDALLDRRSILRGDQMPAACRYWSTATAQTVGWLRQHENQLTAPADVVMVSQFHMLSNRMGLTASDEVYLVWLASWVLSAPASTPQYFADAVDAPDRAAHEQSKLRASSFDAQRPRSGPPLVRSLDFAIGEPVPLPEPRHVGLERPLRDVIGGRRSHRTGFVGPLELADLSAVLGYGAGFVGSELMTSEDPQSERAVRAFPSAGASYPTVVRVMAFDVSGLRPAVYEYLPWKNSLQAVAQLPPLQALRDSSPFFGGAPPRIDVATVPVVLFLAADISVMRERYGLRAHRFAALEIGHAAQNTLLVATALGLPSVPVGGFFDDAACELVQLDGYDEILGYLLPIGAPPTHDEVNSKARLTEGRTR